MDFNELTGQYFAELEKIGYFDFEAKSNSENKGVIITMHKGFHRYSMGLKTSKSSIFDENAILAFLIVIESFAVFDALRKEETLSVFINDLMISGFTDIKKMSPQDSFTVMCTMDSERFVVKVSYENISEQIAAAKEIRLAEAVKTGVYRGIDPRYKTEKPISDLRRPGINRLIDTDINSQNGITGAVESEEFQQVDFDMMDGHDFERFCAELLKQNGYRNVEVTKGSGDQGIDIVASRFGTKYGIQCKCYNSDVGNKAVMEAHAGIAFYGCEIGIVLTNRFYSRAARALAKKTGIILWDRNDLLKLIRQST